MSLNGSAQSIGSPSRMRGKEGDELGLGQTIRITPAYAGKSKSLPSLHIGSRDHPRVCGEKAGLVFQLACPLGSPPRVRGKAVHHKHRHSPGRITPACAGKSCPPQAPTFTRQDHPRVCGEKPIFPSGAASTVGSPPRVWGKEENLAEDTLPTGITPAYAGKRIWNSTAL